MRRKLYGNTAFIQKINKGVVFSKGFWKKRKNKKNYFYFKQRKYNSKRIV